MMLRMKRRIAVAGVAVAVLALAGVAAAANTVATKQQLRGHLPDLGEAPSMRVFTTAAAYDGYRTSSGQADVFPASDRLFMSFDKEILALYARGNDTGGRCLRGGPTAALAGDSVTLDLQWEAGTCGAPATAHYPFALVSLSRALDDGGAWIHAGRTVCAAPPRVTPVARAAVSGTASPTPTAETPAATGSSSGSAAPSATGAASGAAATRTPTPTVAAASPPPSLTPTRTGAPSASAVAVASTVPVGLVAGGGPDVFLAGPVLVLGFGLRPTFL